MKFYLIFGLMLVDKRIGVLAFLAHAIYIAISQFNGWHDMLKMGSLWHIHFFLGMAVYALSNRLSQLWAVPSAILGFMGVAAYIWQYNLDMTTLMWNEWLLLLLAPSFALILLAAVLAEGLLKYWIPSWLTLIGDASYSIYLVHSAAISAALIVLKKLGLLDDLPMEVTFLSCFFGSVFAGFLV